eukprot:scaffold294151_cov71-Attheya_sp.AAC.3
MCGSVDDDDDDCDDDNDMSFIPSSIKPEGELLSRSNKDGWKLHVGSTAPVPPISVPKSHRRMAPSEPADTSNRSWAAT